MTLKQINEKEQGSAQYICKHTSILRVAANSAIQILKSIIYYTSSIYSANMINENELLFSLSFAHSAVA